MQNNILENKTELASWATFTGVNIQGSIPISGKDFSIQKSKKGEQTEDNIAARKKNTSQAKTKLQNNIL